MNLIKDLKNIIIFLIVQKKYKRIFFFENKFIEGHLEPYLDKNKEKNYTAKHKNNH